MLERLTTISDNKEEKMLQNKTVNSLKYIIDETMNVLGNVDCGQTKVVWFGYTYQVNIIQQKLHRNEVLDFMWYQYIWSKGIIEDESQDICHDIWELKYNMPFDGSPIIGRTHLMLYRSMWSVPSWVFEEAVPVEFEGELFSAPKGYDYFLTHFYGDYMKIPPENERLTHGTTAFWKEKG
jgi:hypothetical protein